MLIQQRWLTGDLGWRLEGTTKVARDGSFKYSESVTKNARLYRACVQVRGRQVCSKSHRVRLTKPRTYTVTARAAADSVQFGQNVSVAGTVTPRAKGDLVQLVSSSDSWATSSAVAAARVASDGAFTLTAAAGAAGRWQYRVLKPKTLVGKPAESEPVKVTVTKRVPAIAVTSVSPAVLEAGQSVTVTGTADAGMVGRQVQLEIAGASGAWAAAGTGVVDAAGAYSLTVPVNQSGAAVQLRVTAVETEGTAAVSVAAGTVKVFGWTSLRHLALVETMRGSSQCTGGCTGFGWRTLNIGANTYSPAFEMQLSNSGPSTATWNLEYKCTRLRSDYGLASTSATGANAQFAAYRDAVRVPLDVRGIGQIGTVDMDVSGVYRLKLEASKSGSTADGESAWGNPQLLCAL